MSVVSFDIETLALSRSAMALPDPKPRGNLKDEAKIIADIEAKREKAIAEAALDALTGRVALIGIKDGGKHRIYTAEIPERESLAIAAAWMDLSTIVGYGHTIAGHYLLNFDLPFLGRRSYQLGIPIPSNCLKRSHAEWYWSDAFVDLSKMWQLGRRDTNISLERLSRALKLDGKAGDGSLFAAMWAHDQAEAVAYLKQDLDLAQMAAERMLGCLNGQGWEEGKPVSITDLRD